MTQSTRDALWENMRNIEAHLTEVMEAINGGHPYIEDMPAGSEWRLTYSPGLRANTWWLSDAAGDELNPDDYEAQDAADYLSDYSLEVIDERGRNFAVVLTVGGPHIEIEAVGLSRARLEGWWGGDHLTFHADVFTQVLDWFIERD